MNTLVEEIRRKVIGDFWTWIVVIILWAVIIYTNSHNSGIDRLYSLVTALIPSSILAYAGLKPHIKALIKNQENEI